MTDNLQDDVVAVGRIAAIKTILEVVCRTTGMGFAAVARVTENRWIACAVRDEINFGLRPGGELKVETTICDEIRDSGQEVIIDHVAEDDVFCNHPTPAMYGFQSYISLPIFFPPGVFFGTLCAIDPRPAKVNTPHIIGMFRMFADLIAFHLHAHERLAANDTALRDERATAELREQFIAVLGHDLRNPLASIDAGARMLLNENLSDRSTFILQTVQNSVRRMAGLIDNVLDFAQGRLGGGLSLERSADLLLTPMLEQVVDELRSAWPDRRIETRFAIAHPVTCDVVRIGQLLSNLVANALTHGAPKGLVGVSASTDGQTFELTVTNQGEPIPPAVVQQLFQPYFRISKRAKQGLGLGLYISHEIVRSHGGSLDVLSTREETRFTARFPCT